MREIVVVIVSSLLLPACLGGWRRSGLVRWEAMDSWKLLDVNVI